MTLPDGSTAINTYDIASQLISTSDKAQGGSPIFEANYQYNGAGLLVSARFQTLPLEPRVSGKDSFSYNGANQMTQMNGQPFSYDQDGNMTMGVIGGVLQNLEYDELNWLIKVGQDTYEYDSEGLRVQASVGGRTVRYVQDPNAPYTRLLEEHDAQGNIVARYIYGVGLISRHDNAGNSSAYSNTYLSSLNSMGDIWIFRSR